MVISTPLPRIGPTIELSDVSTAAMGVGEVDRTDSNGGCTT